MAGDETKNCIFCKIIRGEIPSEIIHRDEHFVVINDISPKAPIHLLVIPIKHIPTLNELNNGPENGGLLLKAAEMAKELGVAEQGYRLILNCNEMGGQTVFHLHLHLLAGKQMFGF